MSLKNKILLFILVLGLAGPFGPTPAPQPAHAAGILNPTREVAIVSLFDGSAETQIAPTNMGASKTITFLDSGTITKVCFVFTVGTLTEADDGSVFFFDADPVIAIEEADMTVAEAQTAVARFDITTEDYSVEFATAQFACLRDLNSRFHSITHVVYHNTDAGTLTDEDIEIHVWYKRDD